jgi:hypothetical protein
MLGMFEAGLFPGMRMFAVQFQISADFACRDGILSELVQTFWRY